MIPGALQSIAATVHRLCCHLLRLPPLVQRFFHAPCQSPLIETQGYAMKALWKAVFASLNPSPVFEAVAKLDAVWNEHLRSEFEAHSANETLSAMVENPTVKLMPVMLGGDERRESKSSTPDVSSAKFRQMQRPFGSRGPSGRDASSRRLSSGSLTPSRWIGSCPAFRQPQSGSRSRC